MIEQHFQGEIGGGELPLVSIHTFDIDGAVDYLLLDIKPARRVWFSLTVWDSEHVLRAQFFYGKAPDTVVIHKDQAHTSSLTLPGALPSGQWRIEVTGKDHVFTAESRNGIAYTIGVRTGTGALPESVQIQRLGDSLWGEGERSVPGFTLSRFDWEHVVTPESRWYKGDFHTHTILSDGKLTPDEGMRQAEKMGLDFFVSTDHNVISTGWVLGQCLVIPGIEITSSKGHFNALGPRKWIDFRPEAEDGGMESEAGMNRVLVDSRLAGAIRSVNHPLLKPWDWQFKDTRLEEVDTLEIWNDPTYPDNPQATEDALQLWDRIWQAGFTVWGIGGSDAHLRPDESYVDGGEPSVIGDPATYVLSEGLSATGILQAVKQGRVYVSRGPIVETDIVVDDYHFPIGSDLTQALTKSHSRLVRYSVAVSQAPETIFVRWLINGEVTEIAELPGDGQVGRVGRCEAVFSMDPDRYTWIRVEVRDAAGKLLAFVNPVYCGLHSQQTSNMLTWGGL